MLNPGLYNYWIVIILMMSGLYMVIVRGNLVKKLIGLNIFQVSVFMLYISMGKKAEGTAPILKMTDRKVSSALPRAHKTPRHVHYKKTTKSKKLGASSKTPGVDTPSHHSTQYPQFKGVIYSNPVPHVLILTAIVVGIATTALGLALVVRIYESYGTIEEDEIQSQDEEP